jgi:hypothetical protein
MDAINSAISMVNMGIRYLKWNAWPIVCLLVALYVLKTQCTLHHVTCYGITVVLTIMSSINSFHHNASRSLMFSLFFVLLVICLQSWINEAQVSKATRTPFPLPLRWLEVLLLAVLALVVGKKK